MLAKDSQSLKPGDKAPEFSLQETNGNIIKLSDFYGQRVVLYFYPRDNTPGCTKQACAFRDELGKLNSLKAKVFGISTDNIESHQKFSTKFDLNFSLLADVNAEVSTLYGTWQEKNMYGKKSFGIVRSTFIINEQGNISHVFRRVKVDGHVDQVIKALTSISKVEAASS